MHLSYSRIKQLIPKFNEIALSDFDFWQLCKKEKITVREMNLKVDGYYQIHRGKFFILLDSRLHGLVWRHTAYHELFHHFLDVPREANAKNRTMFKNSKMINTRADRVADALATIAILPFSKLLEVQNSDLQDDLEFAALVRDRIAILAEFGV